MKSKPVAAGMPGSKRKLLTPLRHIPKAFGLARLVISAQLHTPNYDFISEVNCYFNECLFRR